MKSLAGYIMRGPAQAILVISVCAVLALLLPPLSYLSGAAVALVTLRVGARQGLLVIGGAALVVGLLAWVTMGSFLPAPAYLLGLWAPAWLLALYLRNSVSLERSVALAGLLGMGLVLTVHASVPDPALFWQEVFQQMLQQAGGPSLGEEAREAFSVMTGAMAAGLVLSLVGTLFIARWWQALLYNPGGFGNEFQRLRLGRTVALITVVLAGIASLADGSLADVATDLVMVSVVLHLVHGVAVVHGLVAKSGGSVFWLVGMYGLLLLALPQTAVTLSAGGFADAWFDFRTWLGANRRKEGQ